MFPASSARSTSKSAESSFSPSSSFSASPRPALLGPLSPRGVAMPPSSPPPSGEVGEGEAVRLAVVLSAAAGALTPRDLAAAEVALVLPGLAEAASEARVRAILPALADARPGADPTRPPRGASSWRAVYRRVHDPDRRIAIASDVGACVDPLAVGDGSLWMWGVDNRRGMFGIRRADEDGRDLDPEEDEVYAEGSTFAGFAPPGKVRRTAPAPITAWYSLEHRGFRGERLTPRPRIRAVAVGFAHVVAADDLGRVFTWGEGTHGQLGRDVRGLSFATLAPMEPDWPEVIYGTLDSLTVRKPFIVRVAAGVNHTVVVDAGGTAHGWGSNATGQLGEGENISVWVPTPLRGLGDAQGAVVCVAAGRQHTILLDERGAAWLVFSNAKSIGHRAAFGNLHGDRGPKVPEGPEGAEGTAEGSSEGEASQKGVSAEKGPLAPHSRFVRRFRDAPPMIHASMTWDHAIFVDRRGRAWAWGDGGHGRTGLGHERRAVQLAGPLDRGALARVRVERAACGRRHTAFVATDGALLACGRGDDGETGPTEDPGTTSRTGDRLVPVEVAAPPASGSRASPSHSHAPAGDRSSRDRRAAVSAVAVGSGAAAANHSSPGATAAMRASDGRVFTWGHPAPWLGRGGGDETWCGGQEPGAVRFVPEEATREEGSVV